ncbi:MAG: CDC27 family protein, partial [Chitinispirillaceae bacterium]|nr:CDC27 family protein [Chitinispirillaceae bacterium]
MKKENSSPEVKIEPNVYLNFRINLERGEGYMCRLKLSFCRWMVVLLTILKTTVLADDTFNKLFAEKKYREALEYADEKIPVSERDAMTWIKMGEANNAIGMPEKALACFLVSWRMNPNDYNALLGASRAYNKLEQYDNALNMAKKAFEIKPTAEAAWEYAQASLALGRPADAKAAFEKVLENLDSASFIENIIRNSTLKQLKDFSIQNLLPEIIT